MVIGMSTPVPDQYPAADESMLPVVRALYECVREVERVANRHIESMGLTPSQFDVLVVLGDTHGMSCKELGTLSLISGGTLTPVVDRLMAKGLVERSKSEQDSRQTIVSLTPAGQELYERTFLPHVRFMRQFTDQLPVGDRDQLIQLLGDLKNVVTRVPAPL